MVEIFRVEKLLAEIAAANVLEPVFIINTNKKRTPIIGIRLKI